MADLILVWAYHCVQEEVASQPDLYSISRKGVLMARVIFEEG